MGIKKDYKLELNWVKQIWYGFQKKVASVSCRKEKIHLKCKIYKVSIGQVKTRIKAGLAPHTLKVSGVLG